MLGFTDSFENGLMISVDWLSFTIKKGMSPFDVMALFGLDPGDFTEGKGAFGYKCSYRHTIKSLSVLYDGTEDMGVHISVTGSSVLYFLECFYQKHSDCVTPFGTMVYEVVSDDAFSFDFTVLADVLKLILDNGQLTRFDIAIDDIGCKFFTMCDLSEIFDRGDYVSKFKKFREVKERTKHKVGGHSIYLGSRESELMLRIYDKFLEQSGKKKEVSGPWVRWELEFHNDRASAVAALLVAGENLSFVAVGVLAGYLRLVEGDKTRASRCSVLPLWKKFISTIKEIRLYKPSEPKTLDDKKAWMLRQVAPTFCAVYRADGDLSFFYDMIEQGSLRMSKELLDLLAEFERCNNLGVTA